MTITATSEIAADTIPFDLYREVHKGLRHALFQLATTIGATDCEAPAAREAAVARTRAAVAMLHHHHTHEDDFIRPHLVTVAPELSQLVDDGHARIELGIAELEQAADQLSAATGQSATAAGVALYRRVTSFIADYLVHMALEEHEVMDALRSAMSVDELLAIEMTLRGAITPPTMCAFITMMVPAMNRRERADMLGGMHAGAPAEIFELFRATAEAVLAPEQYRTLAADIGIG